MKKLSKRQKRLLIAELIWYTVKSLPYVSIFAILGSFGAYEIERIGFYQFIIQIVLSVGLLLFALHAHYKIYEEVR